jgi:hypothetical protein
MSPFHLRASLRRLTGRIRPIWAAFAVTLLAVVLLVTARLVEGFNRDLLLNLGASLAFVPPTYLVFAPIFERLRQTAAAIEEHLALDLDLLIRHIEHSYSLVCVLETWTGLLEDAHRPAFLRALGIALDNNVNVQILLLDPTSAATQQRAEELDDDRVSLLIADNLRHLYEYRQRLDDGRRRLLDVRVYDASPSVQLYRWDDKAFLSFFPIGKRAYDTRQIETYLASPLGEFAQSRFDGLWSASTTCSLDDYMRLVLYVHHDSRSPARYHVPYVRHDGEFFVDGTPLFAPLADHGIGALIVRLGSAVVAPPETLGEMGDYRMARLEHTDKRFAEVVPVLFASKYGAAAGGSIIHLKEATTRDAMLAH